MARRKYRPSYRQSREDPPPKVYARPTNAPPEILPAPFHHAQPGAGYGGGHPTQWEDSFRPIILRMCALGYTDTEIARVIGVSQNLIWIWKYKRPDLALAMEHWRSHADDRVVRALYERAIGYSYETEEVRVISGEIRHVPVVVHVPPDIKAIETWLFNRRSEEWRAKTDITVHNTNDLTQLSDQELLRIARGEPAKQITNGSGPDSTTTGSLH
jgi:hypothetical protein